MIEQSTSIAKLAAALVQVQATVEGAVKGKANPAFKGTKYADLSAVWEACREQLCQNGLTVVQFPGEMVDNRMTMTTQLSHESGEWMRGTLSIPLSKVDAQGYGSAVTYARRYALAAVVGVCPEDDDGNAASQRGPQQRAANSNAITGDQLSQLETLFGQSTLNLKSALTYYQIERLSDLPAAQFLDAKERLEANIGQKAAA